MKLHPLALAFSFAPALTTAAATCYNGVHIFAARATNEPQEFSVTDVPANVTRDAIPDSFVTRLVYPANQSIPMSSNLGTASLSAQVHAYHAACPQGQMVLIGFSQGAMVIGNAMTGGVDGVPPFEDAVRRNIIGVILYGDPQRQGNQAYGRGSCETDGGGLRQGEQARLFNSYSPVLLSHCVKDDPVCCVQGTSWVDHVLYFTQENGADVAAFVRAHYDRARAGSRHMSSLVKGFIPTHGLTSPPPQAVHFVRQHYIILSVVALFFLLHVASKARWRRVYLRLP